MAARKLGLNQIIDKLETGVLCALGPARIIRGYSSSKLSPGERIVSYDFKSRGNSPNAIHILLDAGADVRAKMQFDQTALHHVAKGGHRDLVERLLEAGLDVMVKTTYGNAPLHWGAIWGTIDVAQKLLDAGAVLEDANNENVTPLHFAMRNGRVDMATFLIE